MGQNNKRLNAFSSAALDYCRMGFSIIPIKELSKRPALKSWKVYQNQRADIEQLKKWFSVSGNGMAVILGAVSGGLTCRDFDAMQAYQKWAAAYPELARILPTVETARGRHIYFISDFEKIQHIGDGELRGGGYCLLPPSKHPQGTVYKWQIPLNGNLKRLDVKEAGFIPNGTEHTEHTEHIESIVFCESESFCVFKANESFIDSAIKKTLPENFGQRNRKIFDFVCCLKSNPQLANIEPKSFREVVRRWFEAALPKILTKEFAETWLDFLVAWENSIYCGVDIMKLYESTINLEPPIILRQNHSDSPNLLRLSAFCRELQRRTCGDNPFFLSCRKVATILGISTIQANRYLKLLTIEGVLVEIEKGGTDKNPRKATRYKYICEDL